MALGPLPSRGIWSTGSQEILYCCNNTDYLDHGASFVMGNGNSDLLGTRFEHHIHSLYYDSEALTGDQTYPGNNFVFPPPSGGNDALHLGPAGFYSLSYYTTYIPNSPYFPNPDYVSALWFDADPGSFLACEDLEKCTTGEWGPEKSALDQTLLDGKFPESPTGSSVQWNETKRLIRNFIEYPRLTSSNSWSRSLPGS